MRVKKFKTLLLCVFCLIPVILIAFGNISITHRGGPSTMGVIIGPIVGLPTEDDYIGSDLVISTDYSSYELSASTPYSNGALRAYTTIGVYNINRSKTYNGFAYPSFIRAFKIRRTDGRPIYDNDGILSVSDNTRSLSSEIVNYPSYIYSI